MQISLRSQLMAGAFAVVGTSAIAIAPIGGSSVALSQLAPSAHSIETSLAAFANPFNAILGSFNLVNNDLFNGFETYPGDIPQGIFPQLLGDPLPIARQFGDNLSYYAGNAIAALVTGPTSSANVLATAVWTAPSQLITAFQELLSGDFQGAIDTLVQTFIAPIPFFIDGFVNAITTPISNMIEHTINVFTALPGIVTSGIGAAIDGLSFLTGVAIGYTTEVVTALASLDFEGAWNSYVEGAFSPSGFPGALEQLTLGPGIGVDDDFIPSIRGWITETQNTLRVAISTVASSEEETVAPAAVAAAAGAVEGESSVADNAKAAAAADDSDAPASVAAAGSDDDSTPAGDSKVEAKADTGSSAGAAKSSGGKGHSKSHGSVRKAADN